MRQSDIRVGEEYAMSMHALIRGDSFGVRRALVTQVTFNGVEYRHLDARTGAEMVPGRMSVASHTQIRRTWTDWLAWGGADYRNEDEARVTIRHESLEEIIRQNLRRG